MAEAPSLDSGTSAPASPSRPLGVPQRPGGRPGSSAAGLLEQRLPVQLRKLSATHLRKVCDSMQILSDVGLRDIPDLVGLHEVVLAHLQDEAELLDREAAEAASVAAEKESCRELARVEVYAKYAAVVEESCRQAAKVKVPAAQAPVVQERSRQSAKAKVKAVHAPVIKDKEVASTCHRWQTLAEGLLEASEIFSRNSAKVRVSQLHTNTNRPSASGSTTPQSLTGWSACYPNYSTFGGGMPPPSVWAGGIVSVAQPVGRGRGR